MTNFDEWKHTLERVARNPIPEDQRDEILEKLRETEPLCNGICITAGDIGFPEYGDAIAYPHPDCDLHGEEDGSRSQA